MASGHVWELHKKAGKSDKFYRIYEVNGAFAPDDHFTVFNWGRVRTRGQFQVKRYPGAASMTDTAIAKRDEKVHEGYLQLRNTDLPIIPHDIIEIIQDTIDQVAPAASRKPETVTVSTFDVFTADVDRLIRLVTSSPDLSQDAILLRAELLERVEEWEAQLEISQAQLAMVDDVIAAKVGAA